MALALLPLGPPANPPVEYSYTRLRPLLTSGRDAQGTVYRIICSLPRKEAWDCLDADLELIAFLSGASIDEMSPTMPGIPDGHIQIEGSRAKTLEAVFLATCLLGLSWPEYHHPDTYHLTRICLETKPVYEICQEYNAFFVTSGMQGAQLAAMFIELREYPCFDWKIRSLTYILSSLDYQKW